MKTVLDFEISGTAACRQTGTFQVPSACKQLRMTYTLDKQYGFLVFVAVKDPKGQIRLQKQLSSTPVLQIGETGRDTTLGGIPGRICEGKWQIEVCLFAEHVHRLTGGKGISFSFEITDQGDTVEEYVGDNIWADAQFAYSGYDQKKVYREGARWYKGDFHTHTRLSDGKELPAGASRKAELMGLDYYMATEHNVVHTGWPKTHVCVMPGVEVTTLLGHANLFGLTKRPESLEAIWQDRKEAQIEEDILAVAAECRKNGWLFSVNHPFLYVWQWLMHNLSLMAMDCLEIINDPTYAADANAQAERANRMAVALSDLLWNDGYRICAVGGSDSHNLIEERYGDATEPSIPGDPATWLHMHDLTPEHVIEALRDCRCYVTRHCRMFSEFQVYGADNIMKKIRFGERIPEDATTLVYEIIVTDCAYAAELYCMVNGKKKKLQTVKTGEHTYTVQGTLHLHKKGWDCLRFGAETVDGEFLFFGNAMTKGEKVPHYQTLGEAMRYIRDTWK